jgi:hypothetical protein
MVHKVPWEAKSETAHIVPEGLTHGRGGHGTIQEVSAWAGARISNPERIVTAQLALYELTKL